MTTTFITTHTTECTAGCHNQGHCKPDCFGCKAASVSVSQTAMPTRKADLVARTQTEKTMNKDIPAYRRLRADGLQPKGTRGAAELESRAASRWEVETGQNLGGNAKLGAKHDELQSAINRGEKIAV